MYGRVVWDGMAAYWPTADADPATTDDHARSFAPFWRRPLGGPSDGDHMVRSLTSRRCMIMH